MERISIRNLRGEDLRIRVASGKLLAITNHGVFIGVVIPVAPVPLHAVVEDDLPHVEQSLSGAEQVMDDKSMTILLEVIEQLRVELNPPRHTGAEQTNPSSTNSSRIVRVGDLTAYLIQDASIRGQTLGLTHRRQLIAFVIPVNSDFVEFLLEQIVSRVLSNFRLIHREETADAHWVNRIQGG